MYRPSSFIILTPKFCLYIRGNTIAISNCILLIYTIVNYQPQLFVNLKNHNVSTRARTYTARCTLHHLATNSLTHRFQTKNLLTCNLANPSNVFSQFVNIYIVPIGEPSFTVLYYLLGYSHHFTCTTVIV